MSKRDIGFLIFFAFCLGLWLLEIGVLEKSVVVDPGKFVEGEVAVEKQAEDYERYSARASNSSGGSVFFGWGEYGGDEAWTVYVPVLNTSTEDWP